MAQRTLDHARASGYDVRSTSDTDRKATMHHHCTRAQAAATELRAALTTLRDHALHPWLIDADLYEVDQIIAHLADHSADLEHVERRMPVFRELDGTPRY